MISEFKRNVLDTAISDIENNTPYRITYNQVKKGRKVTDIVFSFENTATKVTAKQLERDKNTGDLFSVNGMSDKQIAVFSKKLAELPELGNMARRGDSVEQFAQMIANELRNQSLQGKYVEHLRKVGFKQGK